MFNLYEKIKKVETFVEDFNSEETFAFKNTKMLLEEATLESDLYKKTYLIGMANVWMEVAEELARL